MTTGAVAGSTSCKRAYLGLTLALDKKMANLSREEPEEHVAVGGLIDGEESRVALQRRAHLRQGVGDPGKALGSGNVPSLDVRSQVQGITGSPEKNT